MTLFLTVICLFAFSEIAKGLQCSDVSLPCITIPQCSTGKRETLEIHQLSNGLGTAKSTATASLCYTNTDLHATIQAENQKYFPKDIYETCNDSVFNLDVIELFIGECSSANSLCNDSGDTYCYSEIDTSPYNKIFEAGIYTPYLNHTGIVGNLMDCDKSRIQHSVDKSTNAWTVKLTIPWEVVYNPTGCPANAQKDVQSFAILRNEAKPGSIFRANLYRVNELSAVSQCSSSVCEYVSWTPTYSNPPAFHEPTKFGYFILG